MKNHFECGEWSQIGPCVYCKCGQRLYNGDIPEDEEGRKEMATFLYRVAKATFNHKMWKER